MRAHTTRGVPNALSHVMRNSVDGAVNVGERQMKNLLYSAIVLLFFCSPALSDIYATSVHEKIPGSFVQAPYDDANQALGPPDERGNDPTPNWYSLGNGGTLIVKFDTPFVDGPGSDLTIYEVGRVGETCDVEISKDGYSWTKVGRTEKYNSTIDINSSLTSYSPSYFIYVKLIDVESDVYDTEKWAGADINAVGATHRVAAPAVKIESVGIEESAVPCLEWLWFNGTLQNYTNDRVESLFLVVWLDKAEIRKVPFADLFPNVGEDFRNRVKIPVRPSGDYNLGLDLYWFIDTSNYFILDSASFPLEVSKCPELGGFVYTTIMSVLDK